MVCPAVTLLAVPSLSSTPFSTFQSGDPAHPFIPFDQSAVYTVVPGVTATVGLEPAVGLVSTVGHVLLLESGVEVSAGPTVGLVPAAGVVLLELVLVAVEVRVVILGPL